MAILSGTACAGSANTPSQSSSSERSPAWTAFERGQTAAKAGDLDHAATFYEEAIRLDPGFIKALEELIALYHEHEKRPLEARVTIDPHLDYLVELGNGLGHSSTRS